MTKLIIEVSEIRGKCPVYKKGDKIVIDGPEIVMEETDAICIYALAPLLHYAVALRGRSRSEKTWIVKRKGCCIHPVRGPGRAIYRGRNGYL